MAQSRGAFYVGIGVFVAIFLGLVGSTLSNFARAQDLGRRMEELRLEQVALQVERAKLEADHLFFQTEEFHELVLKGQGRRLPGETMIILPERVEVELEAPTSEVRVSEDRSISANWSSWLDFFFAGD